jgi:acyl-[acyl-carrier-protein]-phospholipid O-acyltransferase/long-chain-fatty-acid--[acyl-carrier-protein] ligase
MGGVTAMQGVSPLLVVAQLFFVGLACYLATWFIPGTGAAAPGLRINRNLFVSTVDLLREMKANRRQWIGGLGVSWFWLSGAVALSLIPVIVKHRVGAGVQVETLISVFFALGIGLGAGLAAFFSRSGITLRPVPFAALGMALFLIDLGIATMNSAPTTEGLDVQGFFLSSIGLRVTVDIVGLACAGGVFSVPLFSAVQSWAAKDRRARVVAGVSVLTALFMVAGSVTTAILQSAWIGVPEPLLVIVLGVLNIGAAIYFLFWLPLRAAHGAPALTGRVSPDSNSGR